MPEPESLPVDEHERALYTRLRPEIAASIAEHRETVDDPSRVAAHVLDGEDSQRVLLGLDADTRAVYFERYRWNIIQVPVDESGRDGRRRWRVAREKYQLRADAWVREVGDDYWTWLHPRVSWVIETEGRE